MIFSYFMNMSNYFMEDMYRLNVLKMLKIMKSMSEFMEKLKLKHNNFKSLLSIFRIVI